MASTIKVDNVQNQPGTNIINKCSVTTTIGAGAGDTINVCGATVNIGRCGGTVALASGATQTGFGRTGTVDWDTASIKTSTFTAVSGNGYFCNTTGGVLTVNLPAGSAGDIIGLKDYANTWDSNAVTLNPNGAQLIGGGSSIDPTLTSEGGAVLLVYVDGTQGWLTTQQSVTASPTGKEDYIVATGGTPCAGQTSGDYKYHTFTGPGTFCVASLASCSANDVVSYIVVAGGGGGGADNGGGGGAGGFREGANPADPYTASPLAAACSEITVSASPYSITVGAGGVAPGFPPANCGASGANSVGVGITSAGGGGGGKVSTNASSGGSGGGGGSCSSLCRAAGNTPSVSPPQGNQGGNGRPPGCGPIALGGGGGGATQDGFNADRTAPVPATNADGGAGATTSINATPTAYAGGGGGGSQNGCSDADAGIGGVGGGGDGSSNNGVPNINIPAPAGTVNTGGGGGGAKNNAAGNGGSGIVIIRYKYQ